MPAWGVQLEALRPLLDHSDCDGVLSATECASVAPALRSIVEGWDAVPTPLAEWERQRGLLLVALMEECATNNRELQFC